MLVSPIDLSARNEMMRALGAQRNILALMFSYILGR